MLECIEERFVINKMDQAERLRSIVKQNNTGVDQKEEKKETAPYVQNVPEEQPKKTARVITVTSGKGGVGKSSVSINLAVQLQKRGNRVIIFDADFGLANIEVMFGAVPKYNLSDVIFRGKDIKDIIVRGPMDISFVSGGSGINGLGNMTREQVMYLVEKIKELEEMADILIIDTGAGISDSVIEFLFSSQEVILVTTPEPTSITDSYALLKTLNNRGGEELENITVKVVANRVTGENEARNLFTKLDVVVKRFLKVKLEFLGMVPWDANMSKAIMQQKPISIVYPTSEGAKALSKIAAELLGMQHSANEYSRRKGLAAAFAKMFHNKNI